LALGAALAAGTLLAQPKPVPLAGASPFPAQHAKDIKWFDSLAGAAAEAGRTKKPICLILAGQRPKGDC
jgi:hypothetical protein